MIPQGNHKDWPWPLSLIPRDFNAVPSNDPPKQVVGKKIIPDPGSSSLQVGRYGFYFATTLPNKWHFRVGTFRYDDVDHYYTFPTLALKRLK